MDAVDYNGSPLILFHKALTKENLTEFIYRVKMTDNTTKMERSGQLNLSHNRLNVCKKLLAANVKFTKDFMKDYIELCKVRANKLLEKEIVCTNDMEKILIREFKNDWIKEYEDWKRTLKAYSYKLDKTSLISDIDIIKAKEFSINDLLKFNSQGLAKCVFHNDNNPSMKYYPNTNTVHCFSCGKSGDSIAVAQALFGDNFINTVKRLTNK